MMPPRPQPRRRDVPGVPSAGEEGAADASSSPPPSSRGALLRRVASRRLITAGILVASLLVRVKGLGIPFSEPHDFRQTQTAIAVQSFLDRGVDLLHYETPVFGPPWTVPFEFPTFQLSAYVFAKVGLPLDLACRLAALVWFHLSAILLFALVRRWTGEWLANATLAVYVFTPFAILWSRACLIDYAAVALSLAYVLLAGAWAGERRAAAGVAAVLAGALAYVTKITTVAAYLPALALVFAFALVRQQRSPSHGGTGALRGYLAGMAALLVLPVAAGLAWTRWADHVKDGSPATAWLTSRSLSTWNFGTWAQRTSLASWWDIWWRVIHFIAPGWLWVAMIVALASALRLRGSAGLSVLAAFAGAVGTVLTFFNLYVVHDYYLIAVTPPLALLTAAGIVELGRIPVLVHLPAPARAVVLVALALTAAYSLRPVRREARRYAKTAFTDRTNEPIMRLARTIASVTPSDRWVVIEGDDYWNPRLLYWSHRRGFYVMPGITDVAFLAARPEWGTLVCRTCPPGLLANWPERRHVGTEAGHDVFTIGTAQAAAAPAK